MCMRKYEKITRISVCLGVALSDEYGVRKGEVKPGAGISLLL